MTVSGIITVTATATDAVGVTRVDLYVDGVFSVSDTTAPYTFALDTTTLTNGAHSLVCKAYDAANNEGLSTPFSITVSNAAPNLQFTRQLRGSNVAGGETNWGSYTLGNGLYTTGVPFRGINRPGPDGQARPTEMKLGRVKPSLSGRMRPEVVAVPAHLPLGLPSSITTQARDSIPSVYPSLGSAYRTLSMGR
jgi:hypothetical protein